MKMRTFSLLEIFISLLLTYLSNAGEVIGEPEIVEVEGVDPDVLPAGLCVVPPVDEPPGARAEGLSYPCDKRADEDERDGQP